ncbi:unnamed protein product [Blepharisma stoltei]|uniref:non-specific serine/threonine protein kinase n=1 Tax=Blepharisma stoltei TaxID=1481888 RepID=A0AAU9JL83_9CILI|nr:unnamed protein product [Blepharisma stoltei]
MEIFPEELTKVFTVKDHLNGGSYGTIYKAIKKSNGKMYAIKAVARANTEPSWNGIEVDVQPSSWKDIETEMQVLSWANPYKLQLDSFFVKGDTFFMVMDYCRNGDLLKAIVDKIHAHEMFEEDEIWKYFIQISFGLESLHYNGFIHRDLHLQNILLDENRDIKIADFGISRYLQSNANNGVKAYWSPRTHSGGLQAKESDVWAVGCILYYLCNLEHPFGKNKNKIKYEPHKPIRSEYSNDLRYFVDRCLQKQREDRPTIVDILTHEFIVNKTLSLGITIPQTSAMNEAIHKKEIESLRAENARLKVINENKKSEKDLKDRNDDLLNSQRNKIPQDHIKNNEAEKAQKIQELREKRSEILNRPNDPELEQDFRRICSKFSTDIYADDPTLQQAYQDYTNAYRQKTSLYKIIKDYENRTNLIIYDTENDSEEVRIVETPEPLDFGTCIAQLPNGNLFCFGNSQHSGVSLIIDENYKVRELPSGTPCVNSSAIYFNNSVYCFGGNYNYEDLTLSERFDLNENRWIKLEPLPEADENCTSVIFNGNIVISGFNENLLRYSIGNNTFAAIPYDFEAYVGKILISTERLYLIEYGGSIYESELSNETVWRRIGDSIIVLFNQVYLSHSKGKINISFFSINGREYYCFDLDQKNIIDIAFCSEHVSLRRVGKKIEANKWNSQNFKLDSSYLDEWNLKGNTLIDLGKNLEEIERSIEELKLYPNNYDSYHKKGDAFYNLERYLEAIECYDEAIKLYPSYAYFYIDKGKAFKKLKRYLEAIECYEEAIKVDPDDADSYYNKGDALNKLGRYQEAVESYDEAIRCNRYNSKLYNGKGNTLYALERYQEAMKCYDEAIELQPNNPLYFCNRARVFNNLRQEEAALQDFNRAYNWNQELYSRGFTEDKWERLLSKKEIKFINEVLGRDRIELHQKMQI